MKICGAIVRRKILIIQSMKYSIPWTMVICKCLVLKCENFVLTLTFCLIRFLGNKMNISLLQNNDLVNIVIADYPSVGTSVDIEGWKHMIEG